MLASVAQPYVKELLPKETLFLANSMMIVLLEKKIGRQKWIFTVTGSREV
jgi:hypothetical protein